MSELWLLRHAEPRTAGHYIGRGSDPSLTEGGLAEAERIAGILASGKKIPEIICTSPLARAIETAAPLAKRLGIRTEVRDGFAELDFGEWEGLSWKEIEDDDSELWKAWLDNPWLTAPPGGETLKDLQSRVVKELESLLNEHRGRRSLVVSHGGPIRVVLGHALDLDPSTWWSVSIDYGSLSRFSLHSHSSLDLMQWNVPVRAAECDNQ